MGTRYLVLGRTTPRLIQSLSCNVRVLFFSLRKVLMIFLCLECIGFFGSLQTSLLCMVGELAGGGSLTLAVSVSDRGQGTVER